MSGVKIQLLGGTTTWIPTWNVCDLFHAVRRVQTKWKYVTAYGKEEINVCYSYASITNNKFTILNK